MKLKNEKTEDKSFGINETEFVNIVFENEWPLIVKDLAKCLVGLDIMKGKRISEADEFHQS